jgi:leucyl aminopeptidase
MANTQASNAKGPVFEARAGKSPGKGGATTAMDADVVAVFQDSGKKPVPPRGDYAPLVDRLRKGESFAARSGSMQFVRFGGKGGGESVLFAGLGAGADLTEERLRQAGAHAWSKLSAEKCKAVSVSVESFADAKGLKADLSPARMAGAFAEGMALVAYQFNKHRSKREEHAGPVRISFSAADKATQAELEGELKRVRQIAAAVRVTRDWSNEPSNVGTPDFYAAEARRLAREHGLKCTVLGEREAAREKMGLFLGVSRGAVREGRIVVLEYAPKGKAKGKGKPKTVCLVGKGVTFDSGGISIKPSARMEEMKHDMTGAATIMGAMLLASAWQVPNRVVAIMAFCENMPDGDAMQPGNVIAARNGKTVEIINTDAEGRLILADVLDYAHEFEPDAIVDAATLTGAVGIALGKQCCAVLGNNESLIQQLRRAGDAHGERIWQLPLFDEYFDDMKSDTADMKNSCNDSYGGVIRGAIFLKQFVRPGTPWAHLDIAAMASNVGHVPYFPRRGATGAYVRTLARFVADF